MRFTFEELLDMAAQEAGGMDAHTRPAVVKELLHYDILWALSRSPLADRVVFQGGTALRLCYGGQRYSEDLDFVCGADASEPVVLGEMEKLLRKQISDRYGLEIGIKLPGEGQQFGRGMVAVKCWSFTIAVPGFAAAQRINLELCNVPAYQARPMLLQPRYQFLSDRYGDIAIRTETLHEIMADKVLALVARRYLKARDVWDLRWLADRGTQVDLDLVARKASDYRIDDLAGRADTAIDTLGDPKASNTFIGEMSRFVSPSLLRGLMQETPPGNAWLRHAQGLAEVLRLHFRSGPRPSNAP